MGENDKYENNENIILKAFKCIINEFEYFIIISLHSLLLFFSPTHSFRLLIVILTAAIQHSRLDVLL